MKRSGAPQKVSQEKKDTLIGYVLNQVFAGEPVSRQDGVAFLKEAFDVDVSVTTVGRIFEEGGLSFKAMKTRSAGFKHTKEELAEMYVEWIKEHRTKDMLTGLVVSSDATYTSTTSNRTKCKVRRVHRRHASCLASLTRSTPMCGAMA